MPARAAGSGPRPTAARSAGRRCGCRRLPPWPRRPRAGAAGPRHLRVRVAAAAARHSGAVRFSTTAAAVAAARTRPEPAVALMHFRTLGRSPIPHTGTDRDPRPSAPGPPPPARLPYPAPLAGLVCRPGCPPVSDCVRGQGCLAAYLHELPTHLSPALRASPHPHPCLA